MPVTYSVYRQSIHGRRNLTTVHQVCRDRPILNASMRISVHCAIVPSSSHKYDCVELWTKTPDLLHSKLSQKVNKMLCPTEVTRWLKFKPCLQRSVEGYFTRNLAARQRIGFPWRTRKPGSTAPTSGLLGKEAGKIIPDGWKSRWNTTAKKTQRQNLQSWAT